MAKNILVVDDEPNMVETLRKILEKRGYVVTSCDAAKECLEKAARDKPDLILLDVLLPGLSGFAICELLKQNDETKDIPIVMVTALIGKSAKDTGLGRGAKYLLSKPYDPADLLWVVEDAMKK